MFKIIFLISFGAIALVSGLKQEIRFFTEPGFTGDSISFQNPYPTFKDLNGITRNSKSFCSIGHWYAFWDINYSNTGELIAESEELYCINSTSIRNYNAIRHLGGSDITKPSISFYSRSNFWGEEILVEGVIGLANLGDFQPQSLATTGKSRWTLYSEPEFEGTAVCVLAGHSNIFINRSFNGQVGSVVRGCAQEAQANVKVLKANM